MNRDIITFFIKFIYAFGMMNASGKSPCGIYRNIRIISVNIHSEISCRICNKNTDCAKSDYSELLALDFTSRKSFLSFFGVFCDISIFFILLNPVNTSDDITGCKKKTCNHKFLYPVRICSRCIKYDDSLFCTFFQRDIIYAGSCTADCLQAFVKFHFMHCRTSYQNGVCSLCIACRCIHL